MTDIRIGNINTTTGDFSPINITQQTPAEPGTLLRDLIRTVEQMQGQLDRMDRQAVAEFLELAKSPDQVDKHHLRAVMLNVAGVATMAGQVGVPVIEAIRRLKDALGLL
jgi:uncharacterized protein Yka (UPF0111/DUF47 family)